MQHEGGLAVHYTECKNEHAKEFCDRNGFIPQKGDLQHLFDYPFYAPWLSKGGPVEKIISWYEHSSRCSHVIE